MASFDVAAPKVLKLEGGYQDNKYDLGNYVCRGGAWAKKPYPYTCSDGSEPVLIGTKYGIAAPTLYKYLGRMPSVQEMKNLDKADAYRIYGMGYWEPLKADRINNQQIAEIFFDAAIHIGTTGAIRLMQQVLNVAVDGIVGSQTLGAINSFNGKALFEAYKEARKDYYDRVIANNPANEVFRQGWYNRLKKFTYVTFPIASGIALAVTLYFFF
jgi:type VI secretion system secreted protein VgrG